jgi:dihydroorotate dehydrogenase
MKVNLWSPFGLDPYPLMRPFLFLLNPEYAHEMTIKMLGYGRTYGFGPQFDEPDDPVLHTKVFGLFFPNPVGLAAGLDKQAQVIDAFMSFGFGAMEVGTVTPKPQPGNPKPRMFRVPEAKALINRFGFNSDGLDVFAERLKAWRGQPDRSRNPLGVNVGKNKDAEDGVADFVNGLVRVAPYADFVTINVSSPNTPGLRDLQRRDHLTELLSKVMEARQQHAPGLPVLVKIAPDIDEAEQQDVADVALASGVQGLIVSNTTTSRPSIVPREVAKEIGGLSGGPLFSLSTRVLSTMYKLTQGKIPLIGCGGVSSGADAYAKIRAGASLVQIYTCLVYEGPGVVSRIKKELARVLRADGFRSVADAVGADHK